MAGSRACIHIKTMDFNESTKVSASPVVVSAHEMVGVGINNARRLQPESWVYLDKHLASLFPSVYLFKWKTFLTGLAGIEVKGCMSTFSSLATSIIFGLLPYPILRIISILRPLRWLQTYLLMRCCTDS